MAVDMDKNNYDVILGTGKSTSMALNTMYEYYIVDRASCLASMIRIPRKLKKRMFKNSRIKNLYKELTQNGKKYKQWKEQKDGKVC